MEEKLREILEERKNYIHTACLIDSLMRIEDDNFDRCTSISECYYDKSGVAYIKLCSSLIEEDLRGGKISMNKRLIKGILFDLNNVASYNNCGLDRLVRIDENNHELFGCKECVYKDSVCYHYAELKDVKKVVR